MNSAADIQDLKIYYENYILNSNINDTTNSNSKNFNLPSATMLTRIFQTEDSPAWKLLFGHSTAGSYASMLRIQKRYKFHYHFSPNQRTNTVPGIDITFTGYPGILGSTDDFYIVKGRQVQSIVSGVGIKNDNLNLWRTVDVHESVPLAARVMAANRISQNRRTWSKAMSRHPFTGSKQWITVDLSKLSSHELATTAVPQQEQQQEHSTQHSSTTEITQSQINTEVILTPEHKGLIWIVEQLPGRLHSKDVTENFLIAGNTTWVANGLPFFDEILEASGISRDNYSFDLSPADEAELTNLEAVDKYLRTHGFRGDLLGEESIAYGNIDIKLFSFNAHIGMSDYQAFAGPVFMRLQHMQVRTAEQVSNDADDSPVSAVGDERLTVSIDDAAELAELEMITERRPVRNDMRAIAMRQIGSGPFKWSQASKGMASIEHEGHPDEWNFAKVAPKWAW